METKTIRSRLVLAFAFLGAPYQMVLTFQDGSVGLCGVTSFSYSPPVIEVQAVTCESDKIFHNGFE